VAGAGLAGSPAVHAQAQTDVVGARGATPQGVAPEVERRKVEPIGVRTENFEVGLLAGTVGIEDFGSSITYGSRIAYHFTEDLFAEFMFATARAGKTSYEDLSGSAQLLTSSQREFSHYDISAGWNVLPGEVFLGGKHAIPSALYVTLGAGDTRFAGDDHFTVALGTGVRLIVNDWLAVHLDARNLMFRSDLLGRDKITQNLEFTMSLTAFF
jgi:outer membrane beta-barrel protein